MAQNFDNEFQSMWSDTKDYVDYQWWGGLHLRPGDRPGLTRILAPIGIVDDTRRVGTKKAQKTEMAFGC